MRGLKKTSPGSLPNRTAWRQLAARFNVDFTLYNTANAVIVRPVAHKEGLPVFKIQIGINPPLVDIDRIRPFTINIAGPYIEILTGCVVGRGHIKSSVIVPYGRSEYSTGAIHLIKLNLTLSR
ncbi:hypothetical protein D3C75_847810 [compost metagenome]